MARIRRKNQVGFLFIFWSISILAACSQSEAKIWHDIRDFFFPRRTCRTAECEATAQSIKDNQNITVNPCEDFYDFTCGGWIDAHPVPENKSEFDQFDKATIRVGQRIRDILEKEDEEGDPESAKKARQVYRACLNSDNYADENMKFLLKNLEDWGGWPIATENWNNSKFDWTKTMLQLSETSDQVPLLNIHISVDRKNTTKTIIVIDVAHRKPSCQQRFWGDNVKALENWITKVAEKIAQASNQTISQDQLIDDVKEMMHLGRRLCLISKLNNQRLTDSQRYNPRTLQQLQNMTDRHKLSPREIQWVPLIKEFVGDTDIEINDDFTVILTDPEYLLKLISALAKTSQRALANVLMWHKIAYLHGDISEEFRRFGYEYAKTVNDASGADTRWKTCVEYVNVNMGHAIGYEYVKLYFSEEDKKKAQRLVTHIIQSFIDNLKVLDWMDDATRAVAVDKAESMVMAVGYPDWYNKTNIEELYKKCVICKKLKHAGKYREFFLEKLARIWTSYDGALTFGCVVGDLHIVNMENLELAQSLKFKEMLNKTMDITEFFRGPAVVNAYYSLTNIIYIPAGIFQEPFYIKGRPEAMNYGGIGFVIGHELSHAFDARGRQADKFGNLAQWWDEETLNKFLVKMECVRKQYEEYPLPELKHKDVTITKLEGKVTVSENIADNGGLHQAFEAYKKYIEEHGSEERLPGLEDYSPEQLFFIGFATAWCKSTTIQSLIQEIINQVHSPAKYRVLIPLGNSHQFAEAWNCKASDTKLSQKCTMW